ncbi:MAG: T9SS type A sorting domain-containing protein [Bacteroidales bacterium]|nr:T9SS type A sorting domain-containing protein [Bacteroidales bacterium]
MPALLTFTFFLSNVSAQESINASGGNASGSEGSVSYSTVQVVYTTSTETIGSVAQGVQQPYEISVVTAIDEAKGISLSVTVYPNPAADYLTLSLDTKVQTSHDLFQLSFQLYNMQGKLLQIEKITDCQTSIDMSNLVPAMYFVKVVKSNQDFSQQEVKTFKVIKN